MHRLQPVGILLALASVAFSACDKSPTTPSCTYALAGTPGPFGAGGGNGSLAVTTQARCTWTARADADWIAIAGSASGTGSGTVAFTVAANPAAEERSATISVATEQATIRQNARDCAFAVSPDRATYPPTGGRGTITVNALAGCRWTAESTVSWLRVTSGATGIGPGAVEYEIASYDGTTDREGTLVIGGETVVIQQEGRAPCSFTVTPASQTFEAAGGSGGFDVDTASGCTWSARATAAWVHITAPTGNAQGAGRVTFTVDRLTALDERSAEITAGDATFRVFQRGDTSLCEYTVSPLSFKYHWHGTDGQNAEVRVTTAGSCGWTVSVDVPWVLLRGGGGPGPGAILFGIPSYTAETTRSAPIMVRWPTATAGQNVWITQEGCYYALSARERVFGPEGGRTFITVFGTPVSVDCRIGCPWTATTTASWIHITTPMPSAGDNEFFFNVDANGTGAERRGTIVAAGLTLTIVQTAR